MNVRLNTKQACLRAFMKRFGEARPKSRSESGRRQMAYEVGFSNLSYFSTVFKDACLPELPQRRQEFGVLPSEYQKPGQPD